jgi:hypothetical protein
VDRAARAIARTGERAAFDPQVPMFRASILLESEEGSTVEIVQQLDESTRLWHVFGSRWMELRTANVRGRLAQRTGEVETARNQLAGLCKHFERAPEISRVAVARRLLAELS